MLAILATLRSISAHRMTKVRPAAMMPVTETCVRMLLRLSRVRNDAGLAMPKKMTRITSVTSGARLRKRLRTHTRAGCPLAPAGAVFACVLTASPPVYA